MKVIDVLFAVICGRIISWVAGDFLKALGVDIGFFYNVILWLVFPAFVVFCLWLAHKVGKRWLVIFQAAKHLLVAAATAVIDLKLFEALLHMLLSVIFVPTVFAKSASFLLSTLVKYWGNKYWAFGRHEKAQARKEMLMFFGITLIGLFIDVAAFYIFTNCHLEYCPASKLSVKTGVLLAAAVAAAWNFVCYKFLVFKK